MAMEFGAMTLLGADIQADERQSEGGRTSDMVWIPGGTFRAGSNDHYPDEAPVRRLTIDGYWLDRTPVTNRQFNRFVMATGYGTFAETPSDPANYPDALLDLLCAGSLVFKRPRSTFDLRDWHQWWSFARGACWRRPYGPSSNIDLLGDHPVVHVAYTDALAYARWAGKELPTEAEWEFAARGGLDGAEFAWGEELTPGNMHMANIWHGEFPLHKANEDGYERTSPVNAFPANGYGLHDMIGNVWEWTADCCAPSPETDASEACCIPRNPRGIRAGDGGDALEPRARVPCKVIKGGSHLCAPNYCCHYRPAARLPQAIDSPTSHLGFRCVRRPTR
jgi:formylglycine-generating enzyme